MYKTGKFVQLIICCNS